MPEGVKLTIEPPKDVYLTMDEVLEMLGRLSKQTFYSALD